MKMIKLTTAGQQILVNIDKAMFITTVSDNQGYGYKAAFVFGFQSKVEYNLLFVDQTLDEIYKLVGSQWTVN